MEWRTRLCDDQKGFGFKEDGFNTETEVSQEGEMGCDEVDIGNEGVNDR